MMSHQRRMHSTDPEIDWNRLPFSKKEHIPQVYDIRSPKYMTQCPCPFYSCLGSSHIWNRLRNNFNRQNWGDSIIILKDHPPPCPNFDRCRSQVPPRGGLTVATTSQRSNRSERRDGSGGRPCNTDLRLVQSPFGIIQSH